MGKLLKLRLMTGVVGLMALLVIGWAIFYRHGPAHYSHSPVPVAVKNSLPFPVYFPDQTKLPSGYKLDENSFSSGAGVAEFVVDHGTQKLIFTEQTQPSYAQLQTFVAQRIPLHNQVEVTIGTATIGAIGSNTIVSLPTKDNTWILVSAPYAVDQNGLKQVLDSLTK